MSNMIQERINTLKVTKSKISEALANAMRTKEAAERDIYAIDAAIEQLTAVLPVES